jgi:mitochondrial-processing peptidase subunit beta
MVLAAAGDVDHDAIVAAAKKSFSALPPDSISSHELITAEPTYFTGSQVAVRDPDEPTTTLAVAFQGSKWLSPDSITLQVCFCFDPLAQEWETLLVDTFVCPVLNL